VNKKIGFIVAYSLFLVIVLLNAPFTFAQEKAWDWCQVSAYGTELVESEPPVGGFTFVVVAPPSGLEIPNTVWLMNYDSTENYTETLSPGDELQVNIMDFPIFTYNFTAAEEPDHYILFFEGEAGPVRINREIIPEFPPILIVPLFMTATLLALVYRRKRII